MNKSCKARAYEKRNGIPSYISEVETSDFGKIKVINKILKTDSISNIRTNLRELMDSFFLNEGMATDNYKNKIYSSYKAVDELLEGVEKIDLDNAIKLIEKR